MKYRDMFETYIKVHIVVDQLPDGDHMAYLPLLGSSACSFVHASYSEAVDGLRNKIIPDVVEYFEQKQLCNWIKSGWEEK